MTKEECAGLHNAIAELVVTRKMSVQDAVYVFELLKQEIMDGELKKIFAPKLSDKKPTEMG
jgi:hypothetical protein